MHLAAALHAGMLFCALTGELLNARLAEVKAHLKGKKFGRARGELRRARSRCFGHRAWSCCRWPCGTVHGSPPTFLLLHVLTSRCHCPAPLLPPSAARFEADEQELLEEPSLGGSDMVRACAAAAVQEQRLPGAPVASRGLAAGLPCQRPTAR